MGNFTELEERYGLLFSFNDEQTALSKAIELLQQVDLKKNFRDKVDSLITEKIDVNKFIVNFIDK
jgi:hypothetical protein